MKLQLLVVLGLMTFVIVESSTLFVNGQDSAARPSPSACVFLGVIELLILVLFLFFFLSGVWTESPFQMDTAAATLCVLVFIIIDRGLTALSMSDDSNRIPWFRFMSDLAACEAAEDAAAAAAATAAAAAAAAAAASPLNQTNIQSRAVSVYVPAGYCCTQSSIATQCAAYTQYRTPLMTSDDL